MIRSFHLVLLCAACFVWSCTAPADLTTQPLWVIEQSRDILAEVRASGGATAARARSSSIEITPKTGQALRVRGQVQKKKGVTTEIIGPSRFEVLVDGHSVFRTSLRSEKDRSAFDEVIDLGPFAGRRVTLEFRQANAAGETTTSRWRQIALEDRTEIPRRTAADGPNVLVVLVDTVRADHCSLYGHERPTTPNLDRMAVDALVFEQAIAPASWTLPSVASTMTGLPTLRLRATDGLGLRRQHDTLADRLLHAGLTTMAVSTNPLIAPSHRFDQGFETFTQESWRRAPWVNQQFLGWLDRAEGTQWFAYLHYIDPHDPYDAPEPFLNQWADPGYSGPFTARKALNRVADRVNYGLQAPFPIQPEDLDFLRDRYDEEIAFWDAQFGALIGELERRDLLDETLVVVLSDHGEEFADHGKFKHGQHLYQETVRVPLILRFPGGAPSGRRPEPVETRRLMATILDYLGVQAPPGIGNTLVTEPGRGAVAHSYTRYTVAPDDARTRLGLAAIIRDRWKLISEVDLGNDTLFDLETDPGEHTDLTDPHFEPYTTTRSTLDAWLEEHPRPGGVSPEIPEQTMEILRALGYVQ